MELTDIAPIERWVALEKEVAKKSGLNASLFNVDGIRITDFKQWANDLCPAIKATDKGQAFICAVAHMNLAAQAFQKKETVIEECDAGLVKIVIPIFFQDQFVGSFSCCGFLPEEGEIDSYVIHKTTDIPEEEIDRLSRGMRSITTEKAEELASFIKDEIDKIVSESEK